MSEWPAAPHGAPCGVAAQLATHPCNPPTSTRAARRRWGICDSLPVRRTPQRPGGPGVLPAASSGVTGSSPGMWQTFRSILRQVCCRRRAAQQATAHGHHSIALRDRPCACRTGSWRSQSLCLHTPGAHNPRPALPPPSPPPLSLPGPTSLRNAERRRGRWSCGAAPARPCSSRLPWWASTCRCTRACRDGWSRAAWLPAWRPCWRGRCHAWPQCLPWRPLSCCARGCRCAKGGRARPWLGAFV